MERAPTKCVAPDGDVLAASRGKVSSFPGRDGLPWRAGRFLMVLVGWTALGIALLLPRVGAEQNPSAPPQPAVAAFVVHVPLPIQGDVDQRVRSQLERQLAGLTSGGERPVCVLEFAPQGDNRGEGSQFERALALARFLVSDRMSRVRTVAYLPEGVRGHAVLVALACEEIAVSDASEFGPAGDSGELIDAAMREAYRSVADRRRTVPTAVALGLLDPQMDVYRVELLDGGVRYVTGDELAQLRSTGTITKEETLSARGDLLKMSGRDMRLKYGFATHLVGSRRELAGELKISPELLREGSDVDDSWQVVRVDFCGRVHAEAVTRTIRLVQDRLQRAGSIVLIVQLDSPGGSPADSLRLADFLAQFNPRQVRTCAFLVGAARCDAALIAMACDDLVIAEGCVLGGPGERNLTARELAEIREPIRETAKAKHRDWSLWYALLDPKAQVFRCRRIGTGDERFFSREEQQEQEDPNAWQIGAPLETADGLSFQEIQQLGLARFTAQRVEEVPQLYGLTQAAELLQPGWLISRLEALAAQAWFSRTLLFLAFFGLIVEASTPGIGLPGFLSALCFLLFFWAQFLNGTAGWLEVLLFMGGVGCLLIELFVLPGFGVFGVGGALMMVASLILASQTFVIPQNSYQLRQMPQSIYGVVMAALGTMAGIYVMRKYLHRAPWLRNLILQPPHEVVGDLERREALVDYSALLNRVGVATTLLAPAGKAEFGDQLINVITEGELVRPGTAVRVVDVQGNRVLVQPLHDTKGS